MGLTRKRINQDWDSAARNGYTLYKYSLTT